MPKEATGATNAVKKGTDKPQFDNVVLPLPINLRILQIIFQKNINYF